MDSPKPSLLTNLSFLLQHQTVRWIILISASFLLLFVQANQSRIHGESIRYAGIARLMADSGEYTTLRFGQELNHHGPLLFWLTAFAIKLFGPTPFAATLFSRLFGLGCIILAGCLGSKLFGKNVGWMGGPGTRHQLCLFPQLSFLADGFSAHIRCFSGTYGLLPRRTLMGTTAFLYWDCASSSGQVAALISASFPRPISCAPG